MQPNYHHLSARQAEPLISLKRIHVLIMDNSAQVTHLFKNVLSEFGFTNILVAHNGFQGVQVMRQVKIHLIITDCELRLQRDISAAQNLSDNNTDAEIPPLSGAAFVKRLRQSPKSPNPYIPVIMLADTLETLQVLAARDSGVNEIIMKPLQADELCKRIANVIEKPRLFITSENYKGPCRRRSSNTKVPEERRHNEIRVVRHRQLIS